MTATTTAAEHSTALLSQIIAVRTGVKNDTEQALTKYHHLLLRPELLRGQTRTYVPNDDEGFRYPAENQVVQIKTVDVLDSITKDLARLFDVTAMLDWTNQHARADITFFTDDGAPYVLMPDVPVTYLMFLEKQLINLDTLIRKLPVLTADDDWSYDPAADLFKSQPVGTTKSKKVRRNHVLAPATDRHPAQVEVYTEDEPVGIWTTVKLSGAIPAARVNKMLARVKIVTEAVKFAREHANLEAVQDPKPGKRILDFVFNVGD